MSDHATTTHPITRVGVLIVGSGFSGLGMAIRLKQSGLEDFLVLEREDEVGGTWHVNTYPGCACDVPSHLYSFSFAPNPDWSRTYSERPEIGAYLRRCADEHGIRPHVRLRHAVTSADWDDAGRCWNVQTSQGAFAAEVLVLGIGGLDQPSVPAIPGLDGFPGRVFHSARWDHDFDLRGKRVAAVGTGASAIQFVPAIQPEVERLHVLQRTPPWVMPHTGRRTTRLERAAYRRIPGLQKLVRAWVYATRETYVLGFVKHPRIMRAVELIAKRHMRSQIDDPELLRKVTPGYTIGCKRILPSNRWYRTLAQDNVELLTGGIREVRGSRVVTGDGEEREVDAIILGTGFQVIDMPVGHLCRGRDGRTLMEAWEGSPKAHVGTTVAGFPNLFILAGPNVGLGHSSMVYMIESQIDHVLRVLAARRAAGAATVEVRAEAMAAYNSELDSRMAGTVWSSGCSSWYKDASGRVPVLWPDWTFRFRRRARRFDPAEYRFGPPVATQEIERELVPA